MPNICHEYVCGNPKFTTSCLLSAIQEWGVSYEEWDSINNIFMLSCRTFINDSPPSNPVDILLNDSGIVKCKCNIMWLVCTRCRKCIHLKQVLDDTHIHDSIRLVIKEWLWLNLRQTLISGYRVDAGLYSLPDELMELVARQRLVLIKPDL
jgi:hypothetical protein